MAKKLRAAQLIVTPVAVWIDEDTLEVTAGPQMNPVAVSLADLADFVARFPLELAILEEQMNTQVEEPPKSKPVHNGRVTAGRKR